MVDYSSLENCRAARHRGFESLSLRHEKVFIKLLRDRHLFSYTIIKIGCFYIRRILCGYKSLCMKKLCTIQSSCIIIMRQKFSCIILWSSRLVNGYYAGVFRILLFILSVLLFNQILPANLYPCKPRSTFLFVPCCFFLQLIPEVRLFRSSGSLRFLC